MAPPKGESVADAGRGTASATAAARVSAAGSRSTDIEPHGQGSRTGSPCVEAQRTYIRGQGAAGPWLVSPLVTAQDLRHGRPDRLVRELIAEVVTALPVLDRVDRLAGRRSAL